MLIGEIIQRVQSAYSKGVQSKDTRLSPRHIYSAAITGRETVLSQQASKGQTISEWNYQTLPCVELKPHTVNPLNPDNKILRSVHKIPRIINSIDAPQVKYISTIDGETMFDLTAFQINKYTMGNKFTFNKACIIIKDNYFTFTDYKHLEAFTVNALFSDPLEAALFPSLCAEDCIDCVCKSALEHDFFLDGRLEKAVVDIAVEELIVIFSQMREDKFSNAADDNSGQVNYKRSQSNNSNNSGE